MRRFFDFLIRLFTLLVYLPKRILKWFLLKAMTYAKKHYALRIEISLLLKKFPKIHRKIRKLAMAKTFLSYNSKNHPEIMTILQASPQDAQLNKVVNFADIDIDQTKRVVLFYVEHTAIFERVTGVQRVCHKLSSSLANNINETIIYYKLSF